MISAATIFEVYIQSWKKGPVSPTGVPGEKGPRILLRNFVRAYRHTRNELTKN